MEWNEILVPIQRTSEMQELKRKLANRRTKVNVLPEGKHTFEAFKLCPYEKTKIVIFGQDPYPNPNNAHGLAFSSNSKQTPASLKNIFKEIADDLYSGKDSSELFKSNNLTNWAKQGILLLNTVLTVDEGKSGSHKDLGWNFFTEKIIEQLNKHPNNLVFMLWGKDAQSFKSLINDRHLILTAAHPSPMSASQGFFGCKHFSKAEKFIKDNFYAYIVKQILETSNSNELASVYGKWLLEKGIKIEYEEMKSFTKFYIEKMPEFSELLIGNALTDNYRIDYRTGLDLNV